MEQPLNRNGSGCIDMTAYLAIRNIMKGEDIMSRTGEIWAMTTPNGKEFKVAIIADHEFYVNYLVLYDTKYEGSVEVVCGGLMYVNPSKIQYTASANIAEYIRTMTKEEFSAIKEGIVKSLDLANAANEMSRIARTVPDESQKETASDSASIDYEDTVRDLEEEIIRLQAEVDVYKDLYDDLMKKVITGEV